MQQGQNFSDDIFIKFIILVNHLYLDINLKHNVRF